MGTPLSRPAVAALASWPRALSHSPLHPKPKRGAHRVPLLSQLPPSAPQPSQAGKDPRGQGGRHHHSTPRKGRGGGGGSGECGSLAPPPRPAQPPVTPPPPPTEWFAPSALFNPRDCSSAGSLPVPALAPGSQRLRGALLVSHRLPPPQPLGTQARPRPAGSQPGSVMGISSVLPLLLLFACSWAPGGANLSQDGE